MQQIATTLDAVCLAAQIILENGGETYRAEETVERMCRGLAIPHVDVFALPTGLMLTLTTEDDASISRIVRVRERSINLARIDRCNAISRQVAQGQLSAQDALERLTEIRSAPLPHPLLLILASCAAAGAFSIMLGGQWLDGGVAFVCGALTQLVTPALGRRRVPALVSGLIAAALATLLTLLIGLFLPGLHIEPILSGTIMPLLPGLATTNAVRDTMRGDLVSGGARIIEAILCAITLAAGIGIVLSIWGGLGL